MNAVRRCYVCSAPIISLYARVGGGTLCLACYYKYSLTKELKVKCRRCGTQVNYGYRYLRGESFCSSCAEVMEKLFCDPEPIGNYTVDDVFLELSLWKMIWESQDAEAKDAEDL